MDIGHQYQVVKNRIEQSCIEANRSATNVELLAVSKGHPPEVIAALATATSQRTFAENYTTELVSKAEALMAHNLRWVYIGPLQSNKIGKIVTYAAEIQTLASEKHARAIAKHARAQGKAPYPVYIAVNAANEPQKSGLSPEDCLPFANLLKAQFQDLQVLGIMSIPPATYRDNHGGEVAPLYKNLRALADQVGAGKLSLGMSGDLHMSIQAGSDCLRVGTAIFGPRSAR